MSFQEDIKHIRISNLMTQDEFAKARASWIDDDGVNSRKIAAILIDTNFLISSWLRRNEDNLDQIISIIEENVGSAGYE